jgi:prepilin-type N-terminal cleavage/methylation domain-containing protein
MRQCRQSGVTLVELVVVLAILAVLGVTVFTALGNVLQVTGAKGASEQVAASIRLARQYAITRGQSHCIQFAGTPNTNFRILSTVDNTTCSGAIVQDQREIGHGLAILTPNNLSVIFDGMGVVRNFPPGNPSVTLVVDSDPPSCPFSVLVTLYGGVRITQGACP